MPLAAAGRPSNRGPAVALLVWTVLAGCAVQTGQPPSDNTLRTLRGEMVIGHEVRQFRPCGDDALWLSGNSPALAELRAEHAALQLDQVPYTALTVTLEGRRVAAPRDGFGSDYPAAFEASRLVYSEPKGHCRDHLIVVDAPAVGALVSSPLAISGRARGSWYSEGDFPLRLLGADGQSLAAHYASAEGEWMTTGFVPFRATLHFDLPAGVRHGRLELIKDNPSERRELDDTLVVPVRFE